MIPFIVSNALAWLCTASPQSRYSQITMAAGSSAQSTIQTDTELGKWEGQEGWQHAPDPGWPFHVGLVKADKPHGMKNKW